MLKDWWTALLDIIYPPKCPVCRMSVATHGAWCARCLAVVFVPREIGLAGHHLSALDSCRVVCEYAGGVKRLIHDMKFRKKGHYAAHLTWLLCKGVAPKTVCGVDLVIPVPLHAGRMAERGYNQTELIFGKWAEQQGLAWNGDVLKRVRPTAPQWELQLAARRKNIKGAFSVMRPEVIQGRNILLVDDIFTSGTTMEECAKQLKQAGALRVDGLALASGA